MKTKSMLFCLVFTICTNTCITANAQGVNKQDSLALVDLFKSTKGGNWYRNDNWLTKRPVKIWYGITVTGTRVTRIRLFANNLQGGLPSSIGNLANLTELELSSSDLYNYLTGQIPFSIGNLVNLENLNLSGNQLSGAIPSSIGNLVKLTNLNVLGNELTGIPASIGNLVNLNTLELGINKLSGTIPPFLGNLVNLTWLELSNNNFSGGIPSFVTNLVKLNGLFLDNNHLTGKIPSSIGNLVNLGNLNLSGNQLSGTIPSSIGNLTSLFALQLNNNLLTGPIPSSIGNLVGLSYALDLSHNQLSGSIPSSIGNLLNLTQMLLDDNQFSGSIPSAIGNLINLSRLHLYNNKLSGSIPSSFGNLGSLETLWLHNNELSDSIPPELGNLTNLFFVNLSHNKLSGRIPSTINRDNWPYVTALDLSYNRFTFNSMEFLQTTFPTVIYGNQAPIPVHQHGNTFAVSAGGHLKNNTYKWFKVGQTGNTTIKGDSVFHPSQSGKYFTSVTNSVATKLTLRSDTINYTAALSNTEVIASSENTQQTQYKTSFFWVYPNPAKSILHVQTNSNASYSLVNQSGQTLITTNITVKGSINISGMPAGLYYLKNNSTGAVQKVIIAR